MAPARDNSGLLATLLIVLQLVLWNFVMAPLLLLRFVSVALFRNVESRLFRYIPVLLLYWIERVKGLEVVFSGEPLPSAEESVLFISNHISDADGVTLMIVAHRAGALGLLRFVAKRAIQFVFPPGTLMRIHDMLFLSRRFEDDETNIRRYLDSFREHGGRLWLWIFPEGTYITPQRARTFEESRAFAQSKGMPPLNNLLMPRVKGMQMIVQGLAGHLDAVYDVTIAYTGPFDTRLGARWPPSFMAHMHGTLHSLNDEEDDDGGANALPGPRGEKPALHIHLRRFSREEVQGADLEKWLFKTWQHKEGLLETFRLRRSFPGAQRHDALPATQWQLELALSCLPPLLVAYHLLRLFVAHKGGLVAALPALLSGSLVVAAATGAFLLFMSKQGRAKAPRARTQRQ